MTATGTFTQQLLSNADKALVNKCIGKQNVLTFPTNLCLIYAHGSGDSTLRSDNDLRESVRKALFALGTGLYNT